MTASTPISRRTSYGIAALVGAALISGGMVLAAPMASAADPGTSPAPMSTTGTAERTTTARPKTPATPRSHHQRARGTAVIAPVAAQVTAAVVATYPGSTVRHLVVDAKGVYRARIVTTDGQRITVTVSSTFTILSAHVAGHAKTLAEARKG